jgi:hypothetical protein
MASTSRVSPAVGEHGFAVHYRAVLPEEELPMWTFSVLAVALLVAAGLLLGLGHSKRSRPVQAASIVALAIALGFGGAFMFGVV